MQRREAVRHRRGRVHRLELRPPRARPHRRQVTIFDTLTYAGNPENVLDLVDDRRCRFVHADICDQDAVAEHLARPRRRRPLRRREPRRPLDQRPVRRSCARTATARTCCCDVGPPGRASSASTTSRPTRCTASIDDGLVHRGRRRQPALAVLGDQGRQRPDRPVVPARRYGLPVRRHPLEQPVRAVPVPARRSSRCSSPTSSTARRCRCTATGRTCATGSSSTTTARPSISSCAAARSARSTTSAPTTSCPTSS